MQKSTKLTNPYSLEETLDKLRHYLASINARTSLSLLDQAESAANLDEKYRQEMKKSLLEGSTVELRALLSPFGDYQACSHKEIPRYRHTHGVDHIDTAMLHIKIGDEEEAIADFIYLHGGTS